MSEKNEKFKSLFADAFRGRKEKKPKSREITSEDLPSTITDEGPVSPESWNEYVAGIEISKAPAEEVETPKDELITPETKTPPSALVPAEEAAPEKSVEEKKVPAEVGEPVPSAVSATADEMLFEEMSTIPRMPAVAVPERKELRKEAAPAEERVEAPVETQAAEKFIIRNTHIENVDNLSSLFIGPKGGTEYSELLGYLIRGEKESAVRYLMDELKGEHAYYHDREEKPTEELAGKVADILERKLILGEQISPSEGKVKSTIIEIGNLQKRVDIDNKSFPQICKALRENNPEMLRTVLRGQIHHLELIEESAQILERWAGITAKELIQVKSKERFGNEIMIKELEDLLDIREKNLFEKAEKGIGETQEVPVRDFEAPVEERESHAPYEVMEVPEHSGGVFDSLDKVPADVTAVPSEQPLYIQEGMPTFDGNELLVVPGEEKVKASAVSEPAQSEVPAEATPKAEEVQAPVEIPIAVPTEPAPWEPDKTQITTRSEMPLEVREAKKGREITSIKITHTADGWFFEDPDSNRTLYNTTEYMMDTRLRKLRDPDESKVALETARVHEQITTQQSRDPYIVDQIVRLIKEKVPRMKAGNLTELTVAVASETIEEPAPETPAKEVEAEEKDQSLIIDMIDEEIGHEQPEVSSEPEVEVPSAERKEAPDDKPSEEERPDSEATEIEKRGIVRESGELYIIMLNENRFVNINYRLLDEAMKAEGKKLEKMKVRVKKALEEAKKDKREITESDINNVFSIIHNEKKRQDRLMEVPLPKNAELKLRDSGITPRYEMHFSGGTWPIKTEVVKEVARAIKEYDYELARIVLKIRWLGHDNKPHDLTDEQATECLKLIKRDYIIPRRNSWIKRGIITAVVLGVAGYFGVKEIKQKRSEPKKETVKVKAVEKVKRSGIFEAPKVKEGPKKAEPVRGEPKEQEPVREKPAEGKKPVERKKPAEKPQEKTKETKQHKAVEKKKTPGKRTRKRTPKIKPKRDSIKDGKDLEVELPKDDKGMRVARLISNRLKTNRIGPVTKRIITRKRC